MPDGPSLTVTVLQISAALFSIVGTFVMAVPQLWGDKSVSSFLRRQVSRLTSADLEEVSWYERLAIYVFMDIVLFILLWLAFNYVVMADGVVGYVYLAGALGCLLSTAWVIALQISEAFGWLFATLSQGTVNRRLTIMGLALTLTGQSAGVALVMQWVH